MEEGRRKRKGRKKERERGRRRRRKELGRRKWIEGKGVGKERRKGESGG